MDDTQCLNCSKPDSHSYFIGETLKSLWTKARAGRLERLSPSDCLNEYAQVIQSNRRNLLLVADDSNFRPPEENHFINGSHAYWADIFYATSATSTSDAADSYSWICSGQTGVAFCSYFVDTIKAAPESWRIGFYCDNFYNECVPANFPVEYCLSERAEPHCKLHFEPNIAIIVTVLNFCKDSLI